MNKIPLIIFTITKALQVEESEIGACLCSLTPCICIGSKIYEHEKLSMALEWGSLRKSICKLTNWVALHRKTSSRSVKTVYYPIVTPSTRKLWYSNYICKHRETDEMYCILVIYEICYPTKEILSQDDSKSKKLRLHFLSWLISRTSVTLSSK